MYFWLTNLNWHFSYVIKSVNQTDLLIEKASRCFVGNLLYNYSPLGINTWISTAKILCKTGTKHEKVGSLSLKM